MTAPALTELPTGWRGILAPLNTRSGDNRELVYEGTDPAPTRPLPLPLMAQPAQAAGHDGAVVVGLITRIWVQDGMLWGEGPFDLADPAAAEWATRVARGVAGWVSVDLSDMTVEEIPIDADGNPVPDDAIDAYTRAMDRAMDVILDGGTPDQPVEDPIAGWLMRATTWKLMGCTLVSTPAFEQAHIDPVYGGEFTPVDATAATTHTGAMIALVPAPADAARLAVEGGEPVAELHCTLAYLGDGADWTSEQRAALLTAVSPLATSPYTGTVYGHAALNPTGAEPFAVYLVEGDGMPDLHDAVWSALADADTPEIPDNHGHWLPHVTAGYDYPVADLAETGPVRFDRLRITFGAEVHDLPLDPATASLTAAGLVYEHGDFAVPEPDHLTALTVTDDGRVYGHLAAKDSCHIGFGDVCVSPPVSTCGYGYFHQGEIRTDTGPLAVGKITLGTGHASMHASARAAAEHYDNTGSVVAVVRASDGQYGPWLCGRLLPGVGDDRIDELRRSGISGDWRSVTRGSAGLELVAVLAVNVPGFPVLRAAAVDGQRALVAAGRIIPGRTDTRLRDRLATAAARVHGPRVDLARARVLAGRAAAARHRIVRARATEEV